MEIHGFNKLTLLDYPGKIACTIFTGSCNFRCPFCHNATLVLNPKAQPLISEEEILTCLKERRDRLEGVAITGGEPTLYPDLPDFIRKIKELGYPVKLDSNGSRPGILRDLINNGLVDHIAMDIKAAPENYGQAVGIKNFSMDEIFESADLLMDNGAIGIIDYEFRTTVVNGIHTEKDFEKIGRWLKGAKAYFLQQFKDSGDLIAPEGLSAPTFEQMNGYREILLPNIPSTQLRGVS